MKALSFCPNCMQKFSSYYNKCPECSHKTRKMSPHTADRFRARLRAEALAIRHQEGKFTEPKTVQVPHNKSKSIIQWNKDGSMK